MKHAPHASKANRQGSDLLSQSLVPPGKLMPCVCRWCGTELAPVPCRPGLDIQVTHGICPICAAFMLTQALETSED